MPVRQWVLTLPYRLLYCLARDHALCRAVLGVDAHGLLAFYARTARAHGIPDDSSGTISAPAACGRDTSARQLRVVMSVVAPTGPARFSCAIPLRGSVRKRAA